MIFAKMPIEKEISTNETLNTSLSPVRIFITNSIRIEVMPECPSELFSVLITTYEACFKLAFYANSGCPAMDGWARCYAPWTAHKSRFRQA